MHWSGTDHCRSRPSRRHQAAGRAGLRVRLSGYHVFDVSANGSSGGPPRHCSPSLWPGTTSIYPLRWRHGEPQEGPGQSWDLQNQPPPLPPACTVHVPLRLSSQALRPGLLPISVCCPRPALKIASRWPVGGAMAIGPVYLPAQWLVRC